MESVEGGDKRGPYGAHKPAATGLASLERKFAEARRGLIAVLFTMSKEENENQWWALASMWFDFSQLLQYPLNGSPNFPWAAMKTMSWAISAISALRPFTIVANLGTVLRLAMLFTAASWISATMAAVVYVAYAFQKGEFRSMLPLHFLRLTARLTTTALFEPLVSQLISVFKCSSGSLWSTTSWACYGREHSALIAMVTLLLPLFALFAFTANSVFFERNLSRISFTAKAHGRVTILMTLIKLTLSLTFSIGANANAWLLHIVVLLAGVLWLWTWIRLLPHYDQRINRMWAAFGGIFFWAAFCAAVARLLNNPAAAVGGFLFVLGAPAAAYAGYMASFHRYQRYSLASVPGSGLRVVDDEVEDDEGGEASYGAGARHSGSRMVRGDLPTPWDIELRARYLLEDIMEACKKRGDRGIGRVLVGKILDANIRKSAKVHDEAQALAALGVTTNAGAAGTGLLSATATGGLSATAALATPGGPASMRSPTQASTMRSPTRLAAGGLASPGASEAYALQIPAMTPGSATAAKTPAPLQDLGVATTRSFASPGATPGGRAVPALSLGAATPGAAAAGGDMGNTMLSVRSQGAAIDSFGNQLATAGEDGGDAGDATPGASDEPATGVAAILESDPAFQAAIRAVVALYDDAERVFHNSPLLALMRANFVSVFIKNEELELAIITDALNKGPSVDVRFLLLQSKRRLEEAIAERATALETGAAGYVDAKVKVAAMLHGGNKKQGRAKEGSAVVERVQYEQLLAESSAHTLRARSYELKLWCELLHPQPDLLLLHQAASRMAESTQTAEKAYRRLIEMRPNSVELLRAYAVFLLEVKREADEANLMFDRADDIDLPVAGIPVTSGAGSGPGSAVALTTSATASVRGGGFGASLSAVSPAGASVTPGFPLGSPLSSVTRGAGSTNALPLPGAKPGAAAVATVVKGTLSAALPPRGPRRLGSKAAGAGPAAGGAGEASTAASESAQARQAAGRRSSDAAFAYAAAVGRVRRSSLTGSRSLHRHDAAAAASAAVSNILLHGTPVRAIGGAEDTNTSGGDETLQSAVGTGASANGNNSWAPSARPHAHRVPSFRVSEADREVVHTQSGGPEEWSRWKQDHHSGSEGTFSQPGTDGGAAARQQHPRRGSAGRRGGSRVQPLSLPGHPTLGSGRGGSFKRPSGPSGTPSRATSRHKDMFELDVQEEEHDSHELISASIRLAIRAKARTLEPSIRVLRRVVLVGFFVAFIFNVVTALVIKSAADTTNELSLLLLQSIQRSATVETAMRDVYSLVLQNEERIGPWSERTLNVTYTNIANASIVFESLHKTLFSSASTAGLAQEVALYSSEDLPVQDPVLYSSGPLAGMVRASTTRLVGLQNMGLEFLSELNALASLPTDNVTRLHPSVWNVLTNGRDALRPALMDSGTLLVSRAHEMKDKFYMLNLVLSIVAVVLFGLVSLVATTFAAELVVREMRHLFTTYLAVPDKVLESMRDTCADRIDALRALNDGGQVGEALDGGAELSGVDSAGEELRAVEAETEGLLASVDGVHTHNQPQQQQQQQQQTHGFVAPTAAQRRNAVLGYDSDHRSNSCCGLRCGRRALGRGNRGGQGKKDRRRRGASPGPGGPGAQHGPYASNRQLHFSRSVHLRLLMLFLWPFLAITLRWWITWLWGDLRSGKAIEVDAVVHAWGELRVGVLAHVENMRLAATPAVCDRTTQTAAQHRLAVEADDLVLLADRVVFGDDATGTKPAVGLASTVDSVILDGAACTSSSLTPPDCSPTSLSMARLTAPKSTLSSIDPNAPAADYSTLDGAGAIGVEAGHVWNSGELATMDVFYDGLLEAGLQAGVVEVASLSRQLRVRELGCDAFAARGGALPIDSRLATLDLLAASYMDPAFAYVAEVLQTQAASHSGFIINLNLAATVLLSLALVVLYFGYIRRRIDVLDRDIKRARHTILMFPSEVLASIAGHLLGVDALPSIAFAEMRVTKELHHQHGPVKPHAPAPQKFIIAQ